MNRSVRQKFFSSAKQRVRVFTGVALMAGVLSLAVGARTPWPVHADDDEREEGKVERGFAIAPVPLNLDGKERRLVGLGSYIVNAQIPCNDCHTQNTSTEFIPTGNPYLLHPPFTGKKKINAAAYLAGGNDFGPLIPGSAHIVSRNLTPDRTGLPEGGHTFEQFREILRTGVDFDHQHPTCSGAPNENCLPPPFNGDVLQIM
ncbi:MAG: hypothetical protein JO150_14940, partial [Acidobacteriaceae bacterium]|nr:hypothetical protein [Acidobacteriaceae bacterium]